jgi:hypothetical protein
MYNAIFLPSNCICTATTVEETYMKANVLQSIGTSSAWGNCSIRSNLYMVTVMYKFLSSLNRVILEIDATNLDLAIRSRQFDWSERGSFFKEFIEA